MLENKNDFPPQPINAPEILAPENIAALLDTTEKAIDELAAYIYGANTPYANLQEQRKRQIFNLHDACGKISLILHGLKV